MRLVISAGEASGELYGAQLIQALQRRAPLLQCFGVGGEHMRAAGCEIVVDAKELSVVGIAEILPRVPKIYAEFRKLIRQVDARRPDGAVVIDSPAFNFRVARQLHQRGIPVVYYVAPQLWAWREGRIRLMRRYVRKALVIFPFEEQWYRQRGVEAEYVGHPLADLPPPVVTREAFAGKHGLDASRTWIALLPGSRPREFAMNIPEMLAAGRRFAGCECILPVATTVEWPWAETTVLRYGGGAKLVGDARAALKHARAAVVASGTATVEAALLGTPMVVVYRISPLTWAVGRPLVRVKHFAMANLIAGEEVVPELIQSEFTAENVTRKLREVLEDGPARERMVRGLAEVRAKLKSGAAEQAAEAVLAVLGLPAVAGGAVAAP